MPNGNAMAPSLAANAAGNAMYARPGPYQTFLPPDQEAQFRQWVAANNVPFRPEIADQDYDMRGFWKALQAGDPRAASAINPNDQALHFPDVWKTPAHQSFSRESQYALPDAPMWIDEARLAAPSGRIIFDERAR